MFEKKEDEEMKKILEEFNTDYLKQKRTQQEEEINSKVDKIMEEINLKLSEFLLVEEAYEEIKKAGFPISYKAFSKRIERKSIRSEKIGKQIYIPKLVLYDWVYLHSNFYSVKKAFEILKQQDKEIASNTFFLRNLSYKTFGCRILNRLIPSIRPKNQITKFTIFVSKSVLDAILYLSKNYVDMQQAMVILQNNNIHIKKQNLRDRMSAGRIPYIKIKGRRLISKTDLDEFIKKEKLKKEININSSQPTHTQLDVCQHCKSVISSSSEKGDK